MLGMHMLHPVISHGRGGRCASMSWSQVAFRVEGFISTLFAIGCFGLTIACVHLRLHGCFLCAGGGRKCQARDKDRSIVLWTRRP